MQKFPFLAIAGLALIISAGEVAAQEPVPAPPTPVPTPTPEPLPDPMPPIPEPVPEPIPNPLPTDSTPPAAAEFPAEEVADTNTVIGRLQADGRFTMLISALKQTGVDQELQGNVTLFAPTDEAFEQLSEQDAMALMSDSSRLSELLRHHVVERAITSSDVMESTEVETMAGDSITVQSDNGMVTVEGASVVQADLSAGGSVVHAVDQVIVKKDKAAVPAEVPPTVPPTTTEPTIPPTTTEPTVPPTIPPVR